MINQKQFRGELKDGDEDGPPLPIQGEYWHDARVYKSGTW